MKFRLGTKISNVIVVLYVLITLLWRFTVEPTIHSHFLISIGIGLFCILFLWAMIKSKVLNPSIIQVR